MIVYKFDFFRKLVLSTLVTTWLSNITSHLRPIWLQTLVEINCLILFPSFCVPPSEVSVLFYSNLSRLPFLGQVVNIDLLLCTGFDSEHAVFVPVSYFYSETNYWSNYWAKQWVLLWSATTSRQFHRKLHFSCKKKVLVAARNVQSIKTFFDWWTESV